MAERYQLPDGRIVEALPQGGYKVVSGGTSPLQDPRLQSQVQVVQGQAAAAPYEAPRAQADLTRAQQQIQAQPLQNQNTKVNIAQGQASIENQRAQRLQGIRQEFNALPEVKNYSEAVQALGGAMKAPDTPQGDLAVVYAFAKAMDPGSVVREGEMEMANQTASIVQRLQQQYGLLQSGKRLPPEVRVGLIESARQKVGGMLPLYAQQYERYAAEARKQGFSPVDVVGKPLPDAVKPIEEAYIEGHGGTPKSNGVPLEGLATGKTRSEYDPGSSAQMNAAIRAGVPYERAAALAAQAGYPAPDKQTYQDAVRYAKQHPDYKSSLAEATRAVPTTPFQQFAASPAGAAISGAGKAATLGFGDEIVASLMPGDYAQNRDTFAAKQGILANQHPTADLLGQVGGGFLTGAGIARGLSSISALRGGMFGAKVLPNLLSKEGMAGDALYGAGYGAGSDNENRMQGALQGGALGAGGGIAARGTINGLASTISPTGGAMKPLYAMGVRPSIGQRIGGPINNFEEKLQSIPLMGDAIKGTRDRARDQFQIGLFNDSLGQIGLQLPKDMKPGHAPHAFAQDAISNAYDNALGNMNASADSQFGQDLGALQQKLGTLRMDSQGQFKKIWDGAVGRRFQVGGGSISGDAYKQAESELSKRVSAIRSNPTGDHELASALEDALGALRGSALRNSPPEAVRALNAADAAHARIVRLEEASRKAGEPAEFSPTQYNTAVKTTSGGVRNRNYLRGDALNTDIAALGTRLGDKVSNSGTIDRLVAGGALYGLGSVSPGSAAALGGITALNAPGIRNVVTELMAPRANPIFDRTADQLRKRARLAGMFGAPAALDYFGQ